MRKWAFLCAVAVAGAIVGCGGSSGGGSSSSGSLTTGSTTGSTRTSGATISIPNPTEGLVYSAYLTGSGRTIGDLYLNVEDQTITDSYLGRTIARQQVTPVRLHLAAFTFQFVTIDVNVTGLNSELFDSTSVLPYSFGTENADGTVALNPGDPGYLAPDSTDSSIIAATRLRVFPGRDSVLPVFLNDSMFSVDTTNVGQVGISSTQFQTVNEPTTGDSTTSGKIAGFLSDMVQFDLSKVASANVPKLAVSGKNATHFYLSGDNYAMSDDAVGSTSGNFEELTLDPANPLDGLMGQPNSVISKQFQFGNFPGTYDLRTADPSDLTGESRITSLFGRWRAATSLINLNNTSFDIIVFPNSNDSFTASSPADAVAIVHTGSTITNMYAGYANFTGSGTPVARLYPLNSFVKGLTTGGIVYDLSGFATATGASTTDEPSVRSGNFTKDSGSAALPSGFTQSGTFVVFR